MRSGKVKFPNSKGQNLMGVIHAPFDKTEKIVIMSHGFTGDKYEHGGFGKAAEAFREEEIAALRFDFGGSGESYPTDITISKQADDLKSAISYALNEGFKSIGLLGHSLGGLCSILAFDGRVKAMVLHAAPTKPQMPPRLQTEEAKFSFERRGYAIITNSSGDKFRVDKTFLKEMENINQSEILRRLTCPVLLIHGSSDERVLPDHSKSALPLLPPQSSLEILLGNGHYFNDGVDNTISLSVEWFKKFL